MSNDVRFLSVAADAQTVVGGATELMTVSPRRMHVMAGGAAVKGAAIAIFYTRDEVGVLLMVRFRMQTVSPEVAGRGIVTAGVVGQISGAAGARAHHFAVSVERGVVTGDAVVGPFGTAVALAADNAFTGRGQVSGGDNRGTMAARQNVLRAGAVAGFATDVQLLLGEGPGGGAHHWGRRRLMRCILRSLHF